MPEIQGKKIEEVWDFRLSTATPLIVRDGTWKVCIFSKNNPDYDPKDPSTRAQPLAVHDTGLEVEPNDHHDTAKLTVCYEWLKSVRDEYSRSDIEELKPIVAEINRLNAELVAKLEVRHDY